MAASGLIGPKTHYYDFRIYIPHADRPKRKRDSDTIFALNQLDCCIREIEDVEARLAAFDNPDLVPQLRDYNKQLHELLKKINTKLNQDA